MKKNLNAFFIFPVIVFLIAILVLTMHSSANASDKNKSQKAAATSFSSGAAPSSMYCWGKVIDATTDKPLSGIEVIATYLDANLSQGQEKTAISLKDGSYVIYTTMLGSYKINVNAPGYQEFVTFIEFDNSFSRIELIIPLSQKFYSP